MKKLLIFLLVFTTAFAEEPDEIDDNDDDESTEQTIYDDLNNIPSSVVNGVNVITGGLVDNTVDLAVKANIPLLLHRRNNICINIKKKKSSKLQWNLYSSAKISLKDDDKYKGVVVNQYGYEAEFASKNVFDKTLYIRSKHLKGVVNTSCLNAGGQPHILQTELKYISSQKKPDGGKTHAAYVLREGDGTVKFFDTDLAKDSKTYLLTYEQLPTKHVYTYGYNDEKYLNRYALNNLAGEEVASIDLTVDNGNFHFSASNGKRIRYEMYDDHTINKITRPDQTQERFFDSTDGGVKTLKHSFPDNRYVKTNFYKRGKNKVPGKGKRELYYKDPIIGAVNTISGPIGNDGEEGIQYSFRYMSELDYIYKTIVLDAALIPTIYDIYENRIRMITICSDKKGSVWRKEHFKWGSSGLAPKTNLVYKAIEDKDGQLIFLKAFTYDDRQNVISEKTYGNFTGNYTGSVYNRKTRTLDPNAECRSKFMEYDELNRLITLKERDIAAHFTYLDDSRLLTSQILVHPEGFQFRTFYEYDDSGSPSLEITDDGASTDNDDLTGVTCRKVIRYQNNPQGFPLVKEYRYTDAFGNEKLFGIEKNTYDIACNLIKKESFDCEGNKVFEENQSFDAMDRVTNTWNRAGHEVKKSYDSNGNLISEIDVVNNITKNFTYNFVNKLIKKELIYSDASFSENYGYDKKGQRIWKSDAYGTVTEYTYNHLGKIEKTKLSPVIVDENGNKEPIEHVKLYDTLGRECVKIDAYGAETKKSFNLDSKPYYIQYHDGLTEYLEYNLHGHPIKKIEKNGSYIVFERDSLGRSLSESFYSPDGELLSRKSNTYSAFFLMSSTDERGIETVYEYDIAGRKKSESRGSEKITYEYDSVGREYKIQTNTLSVFKLYDLFDRVIEERAEDNNGQLVSRIEYVNDTRGKVVQKKTHSLSGILLEEFLYNGKGDLICSIDAEGNETRTLYNYWFKDKNGENVLQTEAIDPQGNILRTTFNVQGKEALKEYYDAFQNLTKKTEYFYNRHACKIRELEHVICDEKEIKTIVTVWEYCWRNRLISLTEAFGTPEAKKNSYFYSYEGYLDHEVKPDGATLNYAYDAKGRVVRVTSSDNSIHYQYTFDVSDNVIEVIDKVHNLTTRRFYNANNILEKEELGNGLAMKYDYDDSNRLIKTTLPDDSGISYRYKASQIHAVGRLDREGNEKYKHTYDLFDISGKLLESTLIGNAGKISRIYDKCLRPTEITHDDFHETVTYDSSGRLIKQIINNEESHFSYDDLGQLTHENNHVYKHDSIYNLISKDEEKYEYNSLNQRIQDNLEYDRNGNLIRSNENILVYDALDRLIQYNDTTYVYDALNRRISKISPYKTTHYFYHGENEIGSANENLQIEELRLLGISSGAEIGASIAFELEGKAYAPIHDHIGNVCALIDASLGSLEAAYKYSAFGECETLSTLNPWRYSSKRFDPESNLIFYGRRYYDPASHRWLTPDPLSFEGGPNLYGFVLNNPLTNVDLYGLFSWSEDVSFTTSRVSNGAQYVGAVMEELAFHLIPIPIVKDYPMAIGHFLQHGSLKDYQLSYERHPTCRTAFYGTNPDPNFVVIFTNGMNNKLEDVILIAKTISEEMRGATVDIIYNGTSGTATDGGESLLQKLGVRCRPDRLLADFINATDREAKARGRTLQFLIIGHSQGGLTINNAEKYISEDTRSRMHIYTVGTARFIPKKPYAGAVNYVSFLDPVIYTDAANISKANVVWLRPHSFFLEHSFNCDTYKDAQRYIYEDMRKKMNREN